MMIIVLEAPTESSFSFLRWCGLIVLHVSRPTFINDVRVESIALLLLEPCWSLTLLLCLNFDLTLL